MKTFNHLTKTDAMLISLAANDIETGNHYLYQRTDDEIKMLNEVLTALSSTDPSDKQKEIIEYYNVCTDYGYAKEHGYISDVVSMVKIKWKPDD